HEDDDDWFAEASVFMERHPVAAAVVALAREGEAANDRMTILLCLCCLANLACAGLSTHMVQAHPCIAQMVVRSLWHGLDDEKMLCFALPAASNLSTESIVLDALDEAEVSLATPHWCPQRDQLAPSLVKVVPLLTSISKMNDPSHKNTEARPGSACIAREWDGQRVHL
ncbi:MAG: hypothetical protein SGPRY_007978, partial [Prymnesium sp.]